MKTIFALLTILTISGCQSTGKEMTFAMEENPERLIKLTEEPKGKMVEPKSTTIASWVDFGVEFEKRGNGLKPINIKLVTASHPGSSSLIQGSERVLSQWIFYVRQVRKYEGNRYLIRVTSPNPDRFCKEIGKKRTKKVICRLNTDKAEVVTRLFNEYVAVNAMLSVCTATNPEQLQLFHNKYEVVSEYFIDDLEKKKPDYSNKQLQAVSTAIENKAKARVLQMFDNNDDACDKGESKVKYYNLRDEFLEI